MLERLPKPAHDGRHDINLGAYDRAVRSEQCLRPGRNQQHRDMETEQVNITQLLATAETVIAHDNEQRLAEKWGVMNALEKLETQFDTALGDLFRQLTVTLDHERDYPCAVELVQKLQFLSKLSQQVGDAMEALA